MKSNEQLRALWRSVEGPVPVRHHQLETLAARISWTGTRALRARDARWTRSAVSIGVIAAAAAILAVAAIPGSPRPTLLAAVSGGEDRARTFETAMVGPRGGAWVIAAAIGNDK
jgi:hypothetical protein